RRTLQQLSRITFGGAVAAAWLARGVGLCRGLLRSPRSPWMGPARAAHARARARRTGRPAALTPPRPCAHLIPRRRDAITAIAVYAAACQCPKPRLGFGKSAVQPSEKRQRP